MKITGCNSTSRSEYDIITYHMIWLADAFFVARLIVKLLRLEIDTGSIGILTGPSDFVIIVTF